MLIGKNWKIEADTCNIILYQRHKEEWKAAGYYSTAQNALKGMVEYEIKATELKDFETIVSKIAELSQIIDGLKGLSPLGTPLHCVGRV